MDPTFLPGKVEYDNEYENIIYAKATGEQVCRQVLNGISAATLIL